MNTCDTCRHWKQLYFDDKTSGDDEDRRFWDSDESKPMMACDHPRLKKFTMPNNDGVSVMDGSYYRAILHTGPKFGCIHWENKNTES